MNVDPQEPCAQERDRFILSKGHIAIAHYAALAECGFIPKEELTTFETNDTYLPTHEVCNIKRGIEISGGSLGYGVSIGVGCALNAKRKHMSYHTYVLIGDGESDEGAIWEAVMSATKYKLDNITIILDENKQQLDGFTKDVMPIEDFRRVFEGFGCHVIEVNGNSIEELLDAFYTCNIKGKPRVIIAHTQKCFGLPSISGQVGWHHTQLDESQYNSLVKELEAEND